MPASQSVPPRSRTAPLAIERAARHPERLRCLQIAAVHRIPRRSLPLGRDFLIATGGISQATGVDTGELPIPKLRKGSYFPKRSRTPPDG